MLDHVMFVYDFNLRHARHLVSDLTPEQCVVQPGNLRNHVAWTIGHLALASEVVALEFDAEPIFPEAWMPRFMPGAEIVGGVDAWPSMAELLSQLERSHERLAALIPTLSAEALAAPTRMEMVQYKFAEVGRFATYVMTAHEGLHLGQIADVRRALGLQTKDF